ncbi:Hypoxanthine-guanine phosphoribosyltransferase [hydrothermal vent metagenome]|uniref:hypoxanthine phosphoribosyltransferase n=1 Tax=hydrothermal vent metagenome TaxID=652676 RepID=A0A3B1CMS2_9ZZZZ
MSTYKLLISEDEIANKVDDLAHAIAKDMDGSTTILVGLLTGSVVFLSDLMRRLNHHGMSPQIDFMIISSYKDSTDSPGKIEVVQHVRIDVKGKTILLVDDIIDTGRTMSAARRLLYEKGASSVVVCAFLDKPSRRKADIEPDYSGFTIENQFVVGYGLDADNRYRGLPFVATLEE